LTASPISDLNPVHMATNGVLTILKRDKTIRKVKLRDFFLSYRKV